MDVFHSKDIKIKLEVLMIQWSTATIYPSILSNWILSLHWLKTAVGSDQEPKTPKKMTCVTWAEYLPLFAITASHSSSTVKFFSYLNFKLILIDIEKGESLKYSIDALNRLKQKFPAAKIAFGYDIACKLKSSIDVKNFLTISHYFYV